VEIYHTKRNEMQDICVEVARSATGGETLRYGDVKGRTRNFLSIGK